MVKYNNDKQYDGLTRSPSYADLNIGKRCTVPPVSWDTDPSVATSIYDVGNKNMSTQIPY